MAGQITQGTLLIEEIVFDSNHLSVLCGEGIALTHDCSIIAESVQELRSALLSAFRDGLDFACIPMPKPFVLYADHDDWITFFANSKSGLNKVIEPIASNGYKLIRDWQGEF